MKQYTPKLLAYLILLIKAVLLAIPCIDYNTPGLIIIGITMAVIAMGMFLRRYRSLAYDVFWLAAGAILLFIAFPIRMPDMYLIQDLPEQMSKALLSAFETGYFPIAAVLLFVLQLLRKKMHKWIVVLRYIVAYLFLNGIVDAIPRSDPLGMIIPFVVVLCCIFELNGVVDNIRRPRMLTCLMFCLFLFAVHMSYGSTVSMELFYILTFHSSGWIVAVLTAAGLGLLLMAEDYFNSTKPDAIRLCDADLGGVLLCWSIAALLMYMLPALQNLFVLYLAFPLAMHFYCATLAAQGKAGQKGMLLKSWPIITASLLVFSRSTLNGGLLPWTLVLLTVTGGLCWSISRKKGTQQRTMTIFLGIAAVLTAAAIPVESLEDLGNNVPALLISFLLCFCWCSLNAKLYNLDASASAGYPGEYKLVLRIQKYLPFTVLVVDAFRILFS